MSELSDLTKSVSRIEEMLAGHIAEERSLQATVTKHEHVLFGDDTDIKAKPGVVGFVQQLLSWQGRMVVGLGALWTVFTLILGAAATFAVPRIINLFLK